MTTADEFLGRIETFLAETGWSATRFGREAAGDPGLVFDLRAGRSPSADLMDRISAFMSDHGASERGTAEPGLTGANVLLVIGGGIAAYKSLDLIRRLKERGADVTVIMTAAAQEFVTPLAAGALSANRVYTDLFDREDEDDVGHIRLARSADLILVAPATADFMARTAAGRAEDLASVVLLAARCPLMLAPAMNPAMWSHPATQRNVETLKRDGAHFCGPARGEMAEAGEAGLGRMVEPPEIAAAADALLRGRSDQSLKGRHVVVTSGPTHEPMDPVRYLANRSSGRQGHAIAEAAARAGASVTLVSGPVTIPDPAGVNVVRVETARQMLAAVEAALPADVAIMAAAVADWRTADASDAKIKKSVDAGPPTLSLVENPDILSTVGHLKDGRPSLVVGFAAETDDVFRYGREKRQRKSADWIVANDVSPETGIMGGDHNEIHLISGEGVDSWPRMAKTEVAQRLVERIAEALTETGGRDA